MKRYIHFFFAKDFYKSPLECEEYENIELVPTEISEVIDMVNKGTIKSKIADAIMTAIKVFLLDDPIRSI